MAEYNQIIETFGPYAEAVLFLMSLYMLLGSLWLWIKTEDWDSGV